MSWILIIIDTIMIGFVTLFILSIISRIYSFINSKIYLKYNDKFQKIKPYLIDMMWMIVISFMTGIFVRYIYSVQ